MYPSISIYIDTNNGDDLTKARDVIQTIANKGWEVSTNIDCTGVKSSIRNETLVAKENTTSDIKKDNYYIRAYEFTGLSGLVRFGDKEYYSNDSERQDYFIDFCTSVVNPITCEKRDAWFKLCLLWNRAALTSSHVSWRSSVGMLQILGEPTKCDSISGYSAATLYVKDVVNDNYSATWYHGTADSFMKKYNLINL